MASETNSKSAPLNQQVLPTKTSSTTATSNDLISPKTPIIQQTLTTRISGALQRRSSKPVGSISGANTGGASSKGRDSRPRISGR